MSAEIGSDGATLRGGRIPFRVAIVTLVLGLLLTTCSALIGFILYWNQQSIELLRADYLDQVAETTVRVVSRLPETAERLLRVMRRRIDAGAFPTHGVELARGLSAVLEADPEIQWASYSDDATGRFAGANRIDGGQVILNVSDLRVNRGVPREFLPDGRTPYARTPPLTQPYDPRTRAFYRRAAAQPETVIWMPPYAFAEGIKGVTAAMGIRDADTGRTRGVLTVDVALAGVNRFVETLDVGHRVAVVLFEWNGAPLAGAPGPGREAATRAVERWVRRAAGGRPPAAIQREDVTVDGVRWAVAARAITHGAGLEWIVAAAVPDEEFMGTVYANSRTAILIAALGLVVATLAGIALSTGIARSLTGATGALDRIAQFELLPRGPTSRRSMLREIAHLQDAVARVRASLRSFSRYAPEEIVRDVVVSGREAMLSGERREVTVLFSDLRGYSAAASRLRPEDVVAILNDHFDRMVAIVSRHDGFVVDFLGDSVFAVFGAPRAEIEHAERAVHCAVEMQRARTAASADHRARGWPPLEMGIGVHTGPAVVGNMGSRQRIKYGVVGHVVNVAARIETFTVGGQVLVSDATRRILGDRMVATGPAEVEGKGAGALLVWDVRSVGRGAEALALDPPAGELLALAPPIEAQVRLVLGKQVDARAHPARVERLGPGGAEVRSEAPWAAFGAIELVLPAERAGVSPIVVDAKVIALPPEDAGGRAVVRFTGLDWDQQARVDALARRRAAVAEGVDPG